MITVLEKSTAETLFLFFLSGDDIVGNYILMWYNATSHGLS
jgi:E3 ubiquitin-protein ligase BAH